MSRPVECPDEPRRRARPWLAWLAALAAAFAVPFAAEAQAGGGLLGGGAYWETYRFSDESNVGIRSLDLVTAPFGLSANLGGGVRFQAGGAWARGSLVRSDGSEAELSGLTDTELRLSATFGQDLLTLSAVGLIPTGVSELDQDEVDLAGMVSSDVLPFRIGNWGSGGGFGASAALARTAGAFAWGVSAGYVVAREFEPLDGPEFSYRPGNQLHVRAAVDRNFGGAGKGSLSLSWQGFGADQSNGSNLFQPGNRMQALGSYAFPAGTVGSGIFWAGWLSRAEGEYLATLRPAAARTLLFGGAGGRLPMGGAVLAPVVELRLQDMTDGESGYALTAGTSLELSGAGVTFVPSARGRFGSVELGGGRSSGFTGAELGVALRFGGAGR